MLYVTIRVKEAQTHKKSLKFCEQCIIMAAQFWRENTWHMILHKQA